MRGKTLILTGGYGLVKKYNSILGTENIGGIIKGKLDKRVTITSGLGKGLSFGGFNRFIANNPEEIISKWDNEYPALIAHKCGKGQVIIFTSDCSPAWGTTAINEDEFKEMWAMIRETYLKI